MAGRGIMSTGGGSAFKLISLHIRHSHGSIVSGPKPSFTRLEKPFEDVAARSRPDRRDICHHYLSLKPSCDPVEGQHVRPWVIRAGGQGRVASGVVGAIDASLPTCQRPGGRDRFEDRCAATAAALGLHSRHELKLTGTHFVGWRDGRPAAACTIISVRWGRPSDSVP